MNTFSSDIMTQEILDAIDVVGNNFFKNPYYTHYEDDIKVSLYVELLKTYNKEINLIAETGEKLRTLQLHVECPVTTGRNKAIKPDILIHTTEKSVPIIFMENRRIYFKPHDTTPRIAIEIKINRGRKKLRPHYKKEFKKDIKKYTEKYQTYNFSKVYFLFFDRSYGNQQKEHECFFNEIKNMLYERPKLKFIYLGLNFENQDASEILTIK